MSVTFTHTSQNVYSIMPISLVILLNAEHFMVCSNGYEASKNTGIRYVVLNFFAFTYNEISMGIYFTRGIP